MILGSDHSHWDWQNDDQGYCPIDWARSQAVFTFLKACDGASDVPYYSNEIASARLAGKLVSPYVWLYPGWAVDVKEQADFWFSRLKDEPLIAIDFEGYSVYFPEVSDLYGAIERLHANEYTGKIIIYTGHWYWLAHGNDDSYWLQFPVWLARYSSNPPRVTPPWSKETIWQFSASGDPVKYGITNGKKEVDENWFYGTQAELEELFGGGVVPPIDPPPPEGEPMNAHNPNPLFLRTAPRVAPETFILTMPANTQIVGTEIVTATDGSKWLKTTSPQAGYCASWLLVYDTVPPVDGLPVIHIHQLYSASGYPDLVIDKDWTPDA